MTEHTATTPGPHPARYLPGMGLRWLLPLYDPLTRAIGIPAAHRELCSQARLRPGLHVLEIGCGTGNLALHVKRSHPDLSVTGLDPDPDALARAGRKATRAGLALQLDRGFAEQMGYADGTFDRVLSAFMFHHLAADSRQRALAEVRRVLRPGGSLHLLDFGGTRNRSDGFLARMAHHTNDSTTTSTAGYRRSCSTPASPTPSRPVIGSRGSAATRSGRPAGATTPDAPCFPVQRVGAAVATSRT